MSEFSGDVEFCKLLAGRTDIDLVHLLLEYAADAYPQLDRYSCLVEIDRLSVACDRSRLPLAETSSTRERLTEISRVLYDVEGFQGDRDTYYDPDNSYLNRVLERRCGIPITLGILYMAVAARIGVRMFGVNTPGHFVIGCNTETETLYVDAFGGGEILDREACKSRIERWTGQPGSVSAEHFRPASAGDIAVRVLRNLKTAYAMQGDWQGVLPVQERLALMLPQFPQEQRDLGLIYLRTGEPQKAVSLLEEYVSFCGADQAAVLDAPLRTARKMVAELN